MERRVDAIVYRAKFAPTIFAARQLVNHGHVLVNERKVDIPSYQVKPGDELEIHYATKRLTVRVREVPLRVTPGVKAAELYEILASRNDDAEWL